MSIVSGRKGKIYACYRPSPDPGAGAAGPIRLGGSASDVRAEIPAPAATIPNSPVGDQLGWILGQLNSGAKNLGPIRTAEHFAPDYLDALPTKELITTIRDLSTALAPVGLARVRGGQ